MIVRDAMHEITLTIDPHRSLADAVSGPRVERTAAIVRLKVIFFMENMWFLTNHGEEGTNRWVGGLHRPGFLDLLIS